MVHGKIRAWNTFFYSVVTPQTMKPSAPVKFEDLLAAYEWVSSSPGDSEAFVSRLTGIVHWSSSTTEPDEVLPDDIEDGRVYVAVPNKHDLNLGKNLVLTFAEDHLADSYQTVADLFRQRGAYGRFKDFLERKGLLQAWYDFEEKATELALREWAAEEGLSIDAGQPSINTGAAR